MIIDEILDRKEGSAYSAHDFYMYCMKSSAIFGGIGDKITRALDYGTENDIKRALCDYVLKNGYNPKICDYINSVNWLD